MQGLIAYTIRKNTFFFIFTGIWCIPNCGSSFWLWAHYAPMRICTSNLHFTCNVCPDTKGRDIWVKVKLHNRVTYNHHAVLLVIKY
jgi:hypothetical protein